MNTLMHMFSYPFMQKALIVGILVSLCASLLGTNLVLKKYSMIGDGLSHVAFGAMAAATAFNAAPLQIAMPIVIVVAIILLRLDENNKLKGDSAIALISTGSLAIGVMIISMNSGMNTDVENYMFGSILSISDEDVWLSVILAIIVLAVFVIFYNRLFSITFDDGFSKATGLHTGWYNTILAVLIAVMIVIGMRVMGALLISALIVFPTQSAMQVQKTFRSVVITSGVISLISFIVGLVISFLWGTPSGASIVVVDIVIYIGFYVVGAIRRR